MRKASLLLILVLLGCGIATQAAVIYSYDFASDPGLIDGLNNISIDRVDDNISWTADNTTTVAWNGSSAIGIIDSTLDDYSVAMVVQVGAGSGLQGNAAALAFGTYKLTATMSYDGSDTNDFGGLVVRTFGGTDGVDLNKIGSNLRIDAKNFGDDSLPGVVEQIGNADTALVGTHVFLDDVDAVSQTFVIDNIVLGANGGNEGIYFAVFAGNGATSQLEFVTLESIPEPATLGLVAMAGGVLLFIRRRFMV